MDDEFVADAPAGLKREQQQQQHECKDESPSLVRPSKKPRDNRLRECFNITPLEGGGEKIVCRFCPHYTKTLRKFNPTKARAHLTGYCPGVDSALRQILLETTQAAKKSQIEANEGGVVVTSSAASPSPGPSAAVAQSLKNTMMKLNNRPSPAYISFHTDTENTSLDVTAPIVEGELILRLSFPSEQLRLNFSAYTNIEGAALCIDGFMNMRDNVTWTASMCSMTVEGTRAGPHCQWSLNPDGIDGEFKGGLTRAYKVKQILKTLVLI